MTLIRELESHWLACMATVGGGRVTRLEGAVVLVSPRFPATFLNFMVLRGATPERLGSVLEVGGAVMSAAGFPPALFIGPEAGDEGALAAALSGQGWRRAERQVVLARDLPAGGMAAPAGVDVQEIGRDRLAAWGHLLVAAYAVPPEAGAVIQSAWSRLFAQPGEGSRSRYYLGHLGLEPAGTGMVWMQGEVAGLYCGAVLPHLRRRGVERALVVRRLADAARDGARLAVVQTAAQSPVQHLCVDRLGFRVVYERELWLPLFRL